MKIGFLSLPFAGHLLPMTALARQAKARGLDLVCLGVPDIEPYARPAGLPFVAYGTDNYPLGSIGRESERISRMAGLDLLKYTYEEVFPGLLEAAYRDLPELLQREGIGGLVIDTVYSFVQMVPMALGLPFVQVWLVLPSHRGGAAPPSFVSWPHETTPETLARNAEALGQFAGFLAPMTGLARSFADSMGLQVDWTDPTATVSRLAIIAQTPAAFDYPGIPWPAVFHYAGPFHDGVGREPVAFPWDELDGRPLVYASLGTVVNGREWVHKAILQAAASLPEVQLVLSVGRNVVIDRLGPIPPNAIVVPTAPQVELLGRAALCITHAGLNTALEALAQGVPLVAIPIGYDQPGVAARIAHHSVGNFIALEALTSDRLAALIRQVHGDPNYRARAEALRDAIAAANGLETACNLIEQAFRLDPHQH